MSEPDERHVYQHNDTNDLRVNMKVERNSRGMNYEVTVVNAKTTEEAVALLKKGVAELKAEFALEVSE